MIEFDQREETIALFVDWVDLLGMGSLLTGTVLTQTSVYFSENFCDPT
jgi:hypothetical protein